MTVTYYALGAAVLAAALAFWVTGRRARLDFLGVLAWAGTVVGVTGLTVLAGPTIAGVFRFGYINIAFRQIVVGLPLAAALISVRGLRRGWGEATSGFGTFVLAVALCLAPLGWYMAMVEPNRLVVRTATLPLADLPAGQSLRVGVITDLQTTKPGPHEQAAVSALMAEHPDVILFPGDVFQDTKQQFNAALPALRDLFRQLHAPGGVYLVEGDVDTLARLQAMIDGSAVQLLDNQVAVTRVNGRTVVIGGTRRDYQSKWARDVAVALEHRPDPAEIRILLSHRQDAIELLPESGSHIDLVVSGHTHGGQVVVPFFGPPHTLTQVPRQVAAGGLHKMGERNIFVGTGVGVERNQAPKMRLLDPPSVAVLTITATR
jgi:hypothetical protein